MDARHLDWSLIPSFLAVAETGSLSAASRKLRISQPTVGRHIETMETALEVELFARHARGLTLTQAGTTLIPHAEAMARSAAAMNMAAAGQDVELGGTVRITASTYVSQHILPPIIEQIIDHSPGVSIELDATDATENLLFREADIALRMYRPTQLDTVTRHLGDLRIGLYASKAYLDRYGRPKTDSDLSSHRLVGYDRDERIIQGMRERGLHVGRDSFQVRCDNDAAYWKLVQAGCGIGIAQVVVGCRDPQVEQVLPDLPLPALPVWLTAHETLRRTPRVSRVWDMLAEGLVPVLSPG
ncbi:MAG: LysR family transcriptional regulator [Pseudomonadota bacterium]